MKKRVILIGILLALGLIAYKIFFPSDGIVTLQASNIIDFNDAVEYKQEVLTYSNLPQDFYPVKVFTKNNAGVDWNYASFSCSLKLLAGVDEAYISFADGAHRVYNRLNFEGRVHTGYIYNENNIILLISNGNKYQLATFNYYGEFLNSFDLYGLSSKSNYQLISSSYDGFYLIYSDNGQYSLKNYSIEDEGIQLQNEGELRKDISNIFFDSNSIFLLRNTKSKQYIDILNKKLAVIDIVELNTEQEVVDIRYDFEDGELVLNVYISNNSVETLKQTIPQSNKYEDYYKHTVLLNETPDFDERFKKHYTVYNNDHRYVFENGRKLEIKYSDILDSSSRGINYYKLGSEAILKTNSELDVCFLLIENEHNIEKFIKVYDYYIGLNSQNEICYIDANNSEHAIDDKLYGEQISFGKVYVDETYNTIYYFNDQDYSIKSINSKSEIERVITIPPDIWSNVVNERTIHRRFMVDDKGVALVGDGTSGKYHLYYYQFGQQKWSVHESDEPLRTTDDKKIAFKDDNLTYFFNQDTLAFEASYIMDHEGYTPLFIDDTLYVDVLYSCIEDENDSYKLHCSEYVSYGKYNITDRKELGDKEVIKLHRSRELLLLNNDKAEKIIDMPVREYELSERGVLFTGFYQNAYLYYYDFSTQETKTLYDKGLISEIALKEDQAYFISVSDRWELVKLNISSGNSLEVPLEHNEKSFNIGDDYLSIYAENENEIAIYALSSLKKLDTIDGFYDIWNGNKLYYSAGGYLTEYNPEDKTMRIIEVITYPKPVTIKDNYLYYLSVYDAEAPLCKVDLQGSYDLGKIGDADNILLVLKTHYTVWLINYDQKKRRLELVDRGTSIDYKISDNTLEYKKYWYGDTPEVKKVVFDGSVKVKVHQWQ